MSLPALLTDNLELFQCPACAGELALSDKDLLACLKEGHTFSATDGIPQLFWPADWDDPDQDVTEVVKAFYEENPFPNYDAIDSLARLRAKAREGVFARLLDEQIRSARVLEVGCGTGQLSNFLGMTWGRTVFGADLCLNSLRLANGFKNKEKIQSSAFLQMNLFRPVFKPESFDFVISNGVLHHTGDPYGGFRSIARLVRPGGHIIIGLYNSVGRMATYLRRFIFKISGDRFTSLDGRLHADDVDEVRKRAWFMDQYKHPHESGHTIGEVQRWFDETGFDFVSAIPKATAFEPFQPDEQLFEDQPPGSKLDHAIVQTALMFRGIREGGFFVMIGRRRGA